MSATGRAIAYTGGARLALQGMQVVTFVVVARLLGPATYGDYSIILAVTGFALIFNDLGLQASLVFEEQLHDDLLATAFWLNVAVGVVLSAGLWVTAGPLCALLHHPAAATPLSVAGLSFLLSVSLVPTALLERSLRFGRLVSCEVIGQACASAFTIAGAAAGLGIYSLALGPVVAAVVTSVATLAVTGYRPAGRPSLDHLRSMWRFSSGMAGFGTANYINRNVDTFVLGRFGSAFDLGIYSRGYSLTMAPVAQVGIVIGRVLFPVLTRQRHDVTAMRRSWLAAVRPAYRIVLPGLVGVVFIARPVVSVIFDPSWQALGPVISVLALAAIPQVVCATFGCVFQALGRTRLLFGMTVVQASLVVSGVGLGVAHGGQGVAVGVAVASALYAVLPTALGVRALGLSRRDVGELFLPSRLIAVPAR